MSRVSFPDSLFNKPLSKNKREEWELNPGTAIDTQAQSTAKKGKKYFGYKGHIGVAVQSKISSSFDDWWRTNAIDW